MNFIKHRSTRFFQYLNLYLQLFLALKNQTYENKWKIYKEKEDTSTGVHTGSKGFHRDRKWLPLCEMYSVGSFSQRVKMDDETRKEEFNSWLEKELVAFHRKESYVLNTLDSSYGLDYIAQRARKKREHEEHNGGKNLVLDSSSQNEAKKHCKNVSLLNKTRMPTARGYGED